MDDKVWKAHLALPKDVKMIPGTYFWMPLNPLTLMILDSSTQEYQIEIVIKNSDSVSKKILEYCYSSIYFNPAGLLFPRFDKLLSIHFPKGNRIILRVDPDRGRFDSVPEVTLVHPVPDKPWPWQTVALHHVLVKKASPLEAAKALTEYNRYHQKLAQMVIPGRSPDQSVLE